VGLEQIDLDIEPGLPRVNAEEWFAGVAVVASNQSFTKSAQQLAAANSVSLLHHDQLATVSARVRH